MSFTLPLPHTGLYHIPTPYYNNRRFILIAGLMAIILLFLLCGSLLQWINPGAGNPPCWGSLYFFDLLLSSLWTINLLPLLGFIVSLLT